MADISGKKKKAPLSAGWVEAISKKRPDKAYYFNEDTGEQSWSPPVKEIDKAMEKPKGKKRKLKDTEDEGPDDPPVEEVKRINDTPAMKLYREKMAQRKAAQEAKKNTPKSKASLNQTVTPQKANVSVTTTTPSVQKRLTRRSVAPATDNDSVCSDDSVASMGSKIKQLTEAVEPELPKSPTFVRRFPKIPKVKIVRTAVPVSSSNTSDYGTISDASADQSRVGNGKSDFGTPKRHSVKNLANERLDTLRKSLGTEKEKQVPNKRSRRTVATDFNDNDSEMTDQSKLPALSISRADARTRLNNLDKRVQSKCFVEINKTRQGRNDDEEDLVQERRLAEKCETAEMFCEQMDWEPIEDEKITSEVYTVRLQLGERPAEILSELSNHVINSGHVLNENNAVYVVIDTNVFLSNLPFVEEIRDSHTDEHGRPFIVVPWTVLQELDYIKDDKDKSRSPALKLCARRAVDFLYRHFSSKHPRFLGQTPTDVQKNKERFQGQGADDEILQTCLQVKESARTVVLVSYDKNLCTKAMLYDLFILGRGDSLEKIKYLKAAENTDFLSNSLQSHFQEKAENVTPLQKEMLEAEDIMEEAKAHMKNILSLVVETEMRGLFRDRWEMHVIERPPWSIENVLKCAVKHWIAAVQDSFTTRATEPMLRDLQHLIKNAPDGGRKMPDVQHFLQMCNGIISNLQPAKYAESKLQLLEAFETLRKRSRDVTEELTSDRFKLTVGTEPDVKEQESRAFLAFKLFEELYDYSRDICGMACDALGLQCSIQYNKFNQHITSRIAIDQQKMIGINVNRLAQALKTSITRMNQNAQPNDRIIHGLYEVIMNFAADLNHDSSALSPLDLFCCLRHRRSAIEKGIDQLQDLCVHFGRIANHQCSNPL